MDTSRLGLFSKKYFYFSSLHKIRKNATLLSICLFILGLFRTCHVFEKRGGGKKIQKRKLSSSALHVWLALLKYNNSGIVIPQLEDVNEKGTIDFFTASFNGSPNTHFFLLPCLSFLWNA